MATQTMDAVEHKAMVAAFALVKDPVLWLVSLAFGSLGLLANTPMPWWGLVAAFAGGMAVKLLEFWLRARQQRDLIAEQQSARLERLIQQEQAAHEQEMARVNAAHDAEVARLQSRIDKLESKLDQSVGS